MILLRSINTRWTVFGFLFGCLFPVTATILELLLLDSTISWENFIFVQKNNPVIWIVNLAPFVLGGAFNLVGYREHKLQEANKTLDTAILQLTELRSDLENRVEERTSQLKAISEVSRVATSILEPEVLLSRVVNLIKEEFGYYHSAIFLLDKAGQWAELKEATGEAGRLLKESNHRLEVTELNVVGRAIRSRTAQVSLDAGDKVVKFDNPLLPYTRSELALPLLVGDQILGALDVHSSHESVFTEQNIETLQNMANQVAISLDNARLFQETHKSLNEMRNIQRQYLHEAWIDSNLPQGGVTLAIGGDDDTEDDYSVEVPITLREQIIGQLRLEGEDTLSIEDKNLIQAIATQTALALENARLLNESQSIAMREKFVTEITNKIWASTNMDSVLQTAVRELGQILDATEATIELNIDEE